MSYAVVHMKKLSSAVIKGVQFHHQREKESKTNHDIDYDKSHLNYDIINSKAINFNSEVNSIIKKNVVTNRAIRKDAVVLCDFIVSSDKQFFKSLGSDKQKEFFEKSCEFFKDKYGADKVVYAKVHLDEFTPHMHLGLVPITQECKLSAKSLFSRSGLRELQDQYPKFIQEHGFDLQRGEPKDKDSNFKKHTETIDFKKQQAKELNQELDNTIDCVRSVLKDVSVFDDVKLDKLRIPFKKGKLLISESQYDKTIAWGKFGKAIYLENDGLKIENDSLKNKVDGIVKSKIKTIQTEHDEDVLNIKHHFGELIEDKELEIQKLKKDKETSKGEKDIKISELENVNGQLKDDNSYYKTENMRQTKKLRNLSKENKSIKTELLNKDKALNKVLRVYSPEVQKTFKENIVKELNRLEKAQSQQMEMER